jgi:hypothetical protein
MNKSTIDALRAGYRVCLEASETITRALNLSATEKVNQFARQFIQEYEPADPCTKVGRYITDELRSSISNGDFSGRISVSIFGMSAIGMDIEVLRHITAIMNGAGIRTSIIKAPKAIVIQFNLQDASDESDKDSELAANIEAAVREVGVPVPGIDSIITNIRNGIAHWSDGGSSIVVRTSEYKDNEDGYRKFFHVANRHGLTFSASHCKYGMHLCISW